jgi:hypothetical protein
MSIKQYKNTKWRIQLLELPLCKRLVQYPKLLPDKQLNNTSRVASKKNTPNDSEALIATTPPLTNQLPYSNS